jgi:GNAT superfamily N-acetyltransferase
VRRCDVTPIRLVAPADARALAALHVRSRAVHWPFLPPPPLDDVYRWMRDQLLPQGGTWILQTGDTLLGFVSLEPPNDGPFGDALWIRNLYVADDRVGQGHGAQLLAFALAPERRKHRAVRLWTFQANAMARRFYEHRGFVAMHFTDGHENMERCPDVLYELQAGSTPRGGG